MYLVVEDIIGGKRPFVNWCFIRQMANFEG